MSVAVTFSVPESLSYAMAHNRVPFINAIHLKDNGGDVTGAQVEVAVTDDEGAVSHPFVQVVDLRSGATTILRDVGVQLNPAALLQVQDPRPATVSVSVSAEGQLLGKSEQPVTLLAGNQWLAAEPLGLSFELLSSFVLPNDPAIVRLLDDAAEVLKAATGSPSMEGYQAGPDRADAIVAAIWQATQDRAIRYAEPPASWALAGQKVRTPADVLEGRVGTCLDTTVVLAAALEQAGIRPLLWVIEGHAFLGYWRQESALDGTALPGGPEVINEVDLGRMQLVETTKVTKQEQVVPFEEACRLARPHLRDPERVLAVIDVWAARRAGIIPLPVRRQSADGVQVVEYQPAVHSPKELVIRHEGQPAPVNESTPVPARVQRWKNNLLDLSLRNRLINYTSRAGVRVRVPDGRLGQLEDLIHARRPVALRPLDQVEGIDTARGARDGWDLPEERLADQLAENQAVYTDVASQGYLTRMRNLAYKARTIQEESGANNLYLALGSLVWMLDGRELRSPLILVPVNLTTRARGQLYRLELDESGGSTPNYCLLEKLRQVHGLTIPALANPSEDMSGIDLDAALQATREAIAEKGIPARVEPTADLSILQFAKFRLWKDLDEHWERLSQNAMVRHLIESPTDPFEDPVPPKDGEVDLDALDAACPVPADASQLAAVAEATAGRTFVLEGPPGTGKSQTITNLLTRAVAEGKRVLFVAEKRAALDVVSSRLDAVGMGPFSLDLHDTASKPTVVRAQIKQALDHAVDVDLQGLSARAEELRSSRRTLARYSQRLHDENPAGLSYYSARTSLLTLGTDGPVLPVPVSALSGQEVVERVRQTLRHLPDVADLAQPAPDHPWGFVALTDPSQPQIEAVLEASAEVDATVALLPVQGQLHDLLRTVRTPADLGILATLIGAPVSLDVLDSTRSSAWAEAGQSLTREVAAFVAAAHPGLDVATPAALEMPLADIHAQAQAAETSSFFGRGKRRKAVLARLQPGLRPDAKVSHRDVLTLTTALVQVQGAVRGLAGRAGGIAGLSVPDAWNPFREEGQQLLQRQMEWLSWAGRAVDTSTEERPFTSALRDWLRSGNRVDETQARAMGTADAAFRRLAEVSDSSAEAMTRWSADDGLLIRWTATSPRRRLETATQSLRRWCAFARELKSLRTEGLDAAADALAVGEVQADDAVRAFDRGLAVTSLDERRAATGLDGFDAQGHDRVVRRFTDSVHEVRGHMTTAIPAQVIESRPFKASTARGQVGELQRELAKQRRGLGVRALMQKYGDLITQVMPCVLVSPDSVARFFPVGSQPFDLVVFDEASQIRVADAIGAMGRAKSVVVVGDSKQMPPTTFAEPRAGSDDELAEEETVVEDEESILTEAVLARVPRHWLTWHYRSQDESLIAFSNAHYYESKLSSFPAPTHSSADRLAIGVGVSLVRVDGTFRRSGAGKLLRTNPEEADAIFAEITRRFDESPHQTPSLGVVTFNQQQRAYIEAMIRDSQEDRIIEALDGTNGEGLFVKNLENVQGDERDVILFSTAFSVNDKGVLPLNFGPLTRAGGERRLNVAVTRARKQVILFSSFDPAQIRAEETQSVGIRHLRAYMELAAHGAAALDGTARPRSLPDRHRDEIGTRLRQRGLVVETDVGLSDFRVDLTLAAPDRPQEPLVAVLLDGPGWAARRTVGDRDGLPVEVLGRLMKWPAVERVWMPSWVAEPDGLADQLLQVVGAAKAGRLAPQPPRAPAPAAPVKVDQLEPAMALRSQVTSPISAQVPHVLGGERPFDPYVPRHRGARTVLDELPGEWAATQIRTVAEEIVAHEGPVHLERLARLVAACFDLSRLNKSRIDAIVNAVPRTLRRDPDEPFAWPTGTDPASWTQFRSGSADGARTLDHVSMREIGNAMAALCRDAAGMDHQELAAETLAIFGFKRRTAGINARLDAAREVAMSRGVLHRSPSGRIEAGDR
ncbi:MAG: hypothetical protein V7646_5591 [Pseudonocardia sp.]